MRRLVLPFLLLASACNEGHPPPRAQPSANASHATPPPAPPAAPATDATQSAAEQSQSEDPGLAGLSPAQRRAYELGYRDCSQGRYAPANHLEAYRIGCGAAHDQAEAGRPQG
jgi:hypothetical protein